VPWLFEALDPEGRRITCDHNQWFAHILAGHPELKDGLQAVKNVIEQPLFICDDADHEDRIVYYQRQPTGPLYLRVVAKLTTNDEGQVWTAHLMDGG